MSHIHTHFASVVSRVQIVKMTWTNTDRNVLEDGTEIVLQYYCPSISFSGGAAVLLVCFFYHCAVVYLFCFFPFTITDILDDFGQRNKESFLLTLNTAARFIKSLVCRRIVETCCNSLAFNGRGGMRKPWYVWSQTERETAAAGTGVVHTAELSWTTFSSATMTTSRPAARSIGSSGLSSTDSRGLKQRRTCVPQKEVVEMPRMLKEKTRENRPKWILVFLWSTMLATASTCRFAPGTSRSALGKQGTGAEINHLGLVIRRSQTADWLCCIFWTSGKSRALANWQNSVANKKIFQSTSTGTR